MRKAQFHLLFKCKVKEHHKLQTAAMFKMLQIKKFWRCAVLFLFVSCFFPSGKFCFPTLVLNFKILEDLVFPTFHIVVLDSLHASS